MNAELVRRGLAAAAVLSAVLLVGCSGDGEKRYRVSGEAKCDGEPIPYGDVLFTPDGAKGNSGPQGIASIRDGRYDTRSSGGKGVAGGPTVIRVTGLSGPGGRVICEHEYQAELPRGDGTLAIDVPKKAGGKGGKPASDI